MKTSHGEWRDMNEISWHFNCRIRVHTVVEISLGIKQALIPGRERGMETTHWAGVALGAAQRTVHSAHGGAGYNTGSDLGLYYCGKENMDYSNTDFSRYPNMYKRTLHCLSWIVHCTVYTQYGKLLILITLK